MNGERVGEWGSLRGGTSFFRYESSWANSRHARVLSLSVPLTANLEVRGPQVDNFFDNLLPDNPEIRRRIRTQFQTPSTEAFDLLAAIGRDCAGAVQLLPPGEEPTGWNRIEALRLTDDDVEQTLRAATISTPLGRDQQDEFRISLAGAQEKTALLSMAGTWHRPRLATPTTHILKLPLGAIGNFRGDFSDSVENEWFCAQFLRELDLPVAESTIATFGKQRVLVVKRFDRRWIGVDDEEVQSKRFKPGKGIWIARLPQEDFCQATGRPSTQRYESEGGPSISESLALLANSEEAQRDQSNFVLSQLAFWLLAGIDGHGKNFSIYHGVGGTYGMTPFYDVLSAWPVIGHGKNQLAIEKAKMAMALHGNRPHYRVNEIQTRHWRALAEQTAIPGIWERMRAFVDSANSAVDRVEKQLPREFPERVLKTIRNGVRSQARRFEQAGERTGARIRVR